MTPTGVAISKDGHRCCERTNSFENERNFLLTIMAFIKKRRKDEQREFY